MRWADDDAGSFVVMEKTRMYVFGPSLEPEDPVLSSGYLAAFSELGIQSVLLDEVGVSLFPSPATTRRSVSMFLCPLATTRDDTCG